MPKSVKHKPLYVRRKQVCSSYIQKEIPIIARLTIEEDAIYADCFLSGIIAFSFQRYDNETLLVILALSIIVSHRQAKRATLSC